MTAQWNPEWPVEPYGGHEDHTVVNASELRKLEELRATCLDAPLNLGFLVSRLKVIGATLLAADLASYAEELKRKAEAAS
jgi:hypothetical protein